MKNIFIKFIIFEILFAFLCYGIYISIVIQPYAFDGNEMTLDYHIVVNMAQKDEQLVKEIISNTFREVDRVYNNWNPDSEISKINGLNAYETISLSPELEYFLHLTEKIVKLSEGRFDPTVKPLQQLWKERLEMGMIPSQTEMDAVIPSVGWHHLHFGQGKIYKDHDKTSLDLGGVAKGYCVDLLVERIVEAGFNDVLVEWEGEIRVHGRQSAERHWTVLVSDLNDNMNPQNALAQISLDNQAVATSGDYIQKWSVQQEGAEVVYFHIIDPRTAKPLESTLSSVASATVMAPTCLMADGLAKAAMIQPSLSAAREWSHELSKQEPNIKFWLFSRENAND